jgi:hypothetical protein
MIEHPGDLAGRHRSTLKVQCDQDLSPYRVGQGREVNVWNGLP